MKDIKIRWVGLYMKKMVSMLLALHIVLMAIMPALAVIELSDLDVDMLSFRLTYEMFMNELGEDVLFTGQKKEGETKIEVMLNKTCKAFFYFVDESDSSMIKKISHISLYDTYDHKHVAISSMFSTIASIEPELGVSGISDIINKQLMQYGTAYTDRCHYTLEYIDYSQSYVLDIIPYNRPKGRYS